MEMLVCNKCGSTDVFVKAKNGNQTGLYCNDCGAWIKWLSKDEKSLIERRQAVKRECKGEKVPAQFNKEDLRTIYRVLKNSKIKCQLAERPSKIDNLDAHEYQTIMSKIETMF